MTASQRKYAEDVVPALRSLRPLMLSKWGTAPAINQKTDSAWSIVTEIDIAVEKQMFAMLAEMYPDIAFVGEEAGGDRLAEKFWLVDPIDGTMHYARGLPFCTSMIALIDKGEVVFSAIFDFLNDQMYTATKDGGAFCNDEPIHVSTRPLQEALVSFETNVSSEINLEKLNMLDEQTDIIKSYSAGFEFAMVASGKLEARICLDPYGFDYDFAPGCLLVKEAGGCVANLGASTYDYRDLNFIAANKVIFKELTEGEKALFPIA